MNWNYDPDSRFSVLNEKGLMIELRRLQVNEGAFSMKARKDLFMEIALRWQAER